MAIPTTTLAGAAILLGALTAVATGAPNAGAHAAPASAAGDTASSLVPQAVRAVGTAAGAVTGGRPYEIETERHRGRRVWEVRVAVGNRRPHRFLISADGRTIIARARILLDRDARRVRDTRVGLAAALRIAGRRASGRLDEADLDRLRGGAVVWSVTFSRPRGHETEVTINAVTGRVIRIEHDD